MTNATAGGTLPDVIAGVPVAESQAYTQHEIFDVDAAQQVVERLGPETFSKKALDLVSREG